MAPRHIAESSPGLSSGAQRASVLASVLAPRTECTPHAKSRGTCANPRQVGLCGRGEAKGDGEQAHSPRQTGAISTPPLQTCTPL
eukprot:2606067-Rhodomonas_salina.2